MSVSSTNRERPAAPGHGNGTADVNVDKEHPDPLNGKGDGGPSAAAPPVRPDRHVNRVGEKTDAELLAGYREGDRGSFAALVARYQRELFHFLVRLPGAGAAADDMFQETFLQ